MAGKDPSKKRMTPEQRQIRWQRIFFVVLGALIILSMVLTLFINV